LPGRRDAPAVERELVVSGGFKNEHASDQDPKAFVYEFDDNTFPNSPLLQPRLGRRRREPGWQVVPKQLVQLLSSPDREAAGRAMQAMLKMTKIDVGELRRAYDNT
jgi:hypothetical protein